MTRSNKKSLLGVVFLSLTTFLFIGCSVRVADLTLVSTKNIDLSDTHLDTRKGQRYKGKDCHFILLNLIPLGFPNMEEAVDKALEQGDGNVMIDGVIVYENVWVILGTISCIKVEGMVLNAPVSVSPKPLK